ncbi:cobalamin B12-binding domain-containing protein [Bacillus infantis]|uniref:cobalamin B12-binding domain-containing protein n=1 Tax=Bacillus infantis TaxID=324767 RepID=UPI003CF52AFA
MYSAAAKELASYLLKGDIYGSWAIIQEYDYKDYQSCYIFEHLLSESMHYIGELWQKDLVTVADEHLATGICDYILTKYSFEKGQQAAQGRKALLFCPEGEQHYLGLKMTASIFKENGWEVKNLGASLPLEYALNSAEKWKPDVIGISLSLTHHLPLLKKYIEELEQLSFHPKILVGSRLINRYDFTPFCSKETVLIKKLEDLEPWILSQSKEIAI